MVKDSSPEKKMGRPTIYAEPTKPITLNLPVSVIAFLDSIATGKGISRSMAGTELLEQLRLESDSLSFGYRPK